MSPVGFVTISELKSKAKQILESVTKVGKQIVVTVNGKPVAVINQVKDEDFIIASVKDSKPERKESHISAKVTKNK
jgi:prevent-host-death family protein